MTSPRQAAARELGRLPVDDPRATVVSGRDPGLAAAFLEAAPQRRIAAPAPASRLAVGAGAAMAGRPAVVVLDDPGGVAAGPWDLGGPLVALSDSLEVAGEAHRAGARVLQPAWPTDVGPLLHAAIARARPCCLYLHGLDLPERPADIDAPQPRRARVLTRGDTATVVASGALAPAVAEAAALLARRGVATTALELVMLPLAGLTPHEAAAGILVGGPPDAGSSPDAGGPPEADHAVVDLTGREDLRWAAVASPDAQTVVDVVLRTLRVGPAGRPSGIATKA